MAFRILTLITITCLLFSGCWELMQKEKEEHFISYIVNGTSDTLIVKIGETRMDTVLNPSEKVYYMGSPGVDDNGINILDELMFSGGELPVYIYKGDSLLLTWEGPDNDMGSSIHHFYNHSSWIIEHDPQGFEIEGTSVKSDYNVEFTITEEDFE